MVRYNKASDEFDKGLAEDSLGKELFAGDRVRFFDYIPGKGKVKVVGTINRYLNALKELEVNGDDGKQYHVKPSEVRRA